MQYKIKRKGGISNFLKQAQTTASTYEEARSSVRKQIRASYQTEPGENPAIGLYGYSIHRVA